MHPYFNAFLVALCDVHKVMKNTEAKIHQIIYKNQTFSIPTSADFMSLFKRENRN